MILKNFLYRLATGLIIGALSGGMISISAQAQDLIPPVDEGLTAETGGIGLDAVGCTRINAAPTNAAFEQRVVELVNIERAAVGAPPLKRNSELDFAARDHTRDMAEDDYFSHDTLDRINGVLTKVCGPFDRIKLYYNNYSAAGETLGLGYGVPEDVVKGWMDSPGHKAILLDSKYKEIGSGFYQGGPQSTKYWALDFGAKPDVFPVVIDNEQEQTTNPLVTNYVYGKGVWAEMRLKSDGGAWTAWMPFQEKVTFQLPALNGTHSVSVELRTAGALTAGSASSDTIQVAGQPLPPGWVSVFLPLIKR